MLLSEMFGVERDKDFMIKGHSLIFRISLYTDGSDKTYERLVSVDEKGCVYTLSPGAAYYAISIAPSGIIHLPLPLTDEQRVVLMSLYTMGARYMGMTPDGWKRCFVNKPQKEANTWLCSEIKNKQVLTIAPEMVNCLDSIVSLSDPEPLDIAKALGVEG